MVIKEYHFLAYRSCNHRKTLLTLWFLQIAILSMLIKFYQLLQMSNLLEKKSAEGQHFKNDC
jgi:hypothetical protein